VHCISRLSKITALGSDDEDETDETEIAIHHNIIFYSTNMSRESDVTPSLLLNMYHAWLNFFKMINFA